MFGAQPYQFTANNPAAMGAALGTGAAATSGGAAGGGKGGATGVQPGAQPGAPTYTQPPAGQAPAGSNVFTQSANALNGAQAGMTASMGFRPGMVQPNQISTQQIGAQGYNPATANAALTGPAATYNPALANAQNVQAGQLANTNLQPYMNPFQNDVIYNSINQLERTRQINQNQNGAAATAAKAFGGSRHGLVEAETNRGFADAAATTTAQLNAQNFAQAQAAAGQDINTNMQAGLANQSANLQAGLSNQNAQNAAGQFGASANNAFSQLNSGYQNAANQFNAGSQNAAGQFGASAANAAAMANQSNWTQTGMANQANALQAGMANQSAGLQGNAQMQNAASGLANISNLGFGMGQQINNQQWQQGSSEQQMMQNLINASKGQFGQWSGAPEQSLAAMMQALGGANMGQQSQTTSKKPGLFDYLSLGLGMF